MKIGLRDTSIKTRIETALGNYLDSIPSKVSEILPLKQGLKPSITLPKAIESECLRDTSIKTRIETKCRPQESYPQICVSEILPLKQGLKLYTLTVPEQSSFVSEILPLKQGLKLHDIYPAVKGWEDVSEILPLKQGLKLRGGFIYDHQIKVSEILPLKQGLKQAPQFAQMILDESLRNTSIKTRIETKKKRAEIEADKKVSEIFPLKQGLKRCCCAGDFGLLHCLRAPQIRISKVAVTGTMLSANV